MKGGVAQVVTAGGKRVELEAPKGLQAQLLGDDEFVLFSWNAPTNAEDGRLQSLSPAERDVLARIVAGGSNEEIARARRVSVRTVANQIASIFHKLHVGSRLELIRRFADR